MESEKYGRSSMHSRTRSILLSLSFGSWLISLYLPALIATGSKGTLSGLNILLMGWLGIAGVEDGLSLLGALAWWANPFYLWAITKSLHKGIPKVSIYFAVAFASLTFLLSSYAGNAVPTFIAVIGYGPGVLLWFLAILILAFVVTLDAGDQERSRLVTGMAAFLLGAYLVQVGWRVIGSNASEKEWLPYHTAKRGYICTAEAVPLPISDRQPSIGLQTSSKHWHESLLNWGIRSVQVNGTEYTRAPPDSPESRQPPYMLTKQVVQPARYSLHVEGGHPFDGSQFVRLIIVDNQTDKELGELVYRSEFNRRLGFCPKLTVGPQSHAEEAIKWLAPFRQMGNGT